MLKHSHGFEQPTIGTNEKGCSIMPRTGTSVISRISNLYIYYSSIEHPVQCPPLTRGKGLRSSRVHIRDGNPDYDELSDDESFDDREIHMNDI